MSVTASPDVDTLPPERFRKAGTSACTTREDNERETYCGATGYVNLPEFRDRKSPHYVGQYCTGCDRAYRKAHSGRIAQSAADSLA
ncbi:hypothetical protein [Actinacidiphila glaucinigra]|uniref:hypothetical protein n=1 Tax=Actinacidiphila glaucinigra TaxID=235986 RepID=UPI00366D2636